MHTDEEATIRAFIAPNSRERWLAKLGSARDRRSFLDRLNHCPDIDGRFAKPLSSAADVATELRLLGAPDLCHVISDIPALDGHDLPLRLAIDQTETAGFASLLCCIPGRLAYFHDERGLRRLLLERPGPT